MVFLTIYAVVEAVFTWKMLSDHQSFRGSLVVRKQKEAMSCLHISISRTPSFAVPYAIDIGAPSVLADEVGVTVAPIRFIFF